MGVGTGVDAGTVDTKTRNVVLLVDLEPGMQPVIEDLCRDLAMSVVFTNKTKRALELSRKTRPKLVILDLAVNGELTSVQLITRLRHQAATRTTPIIILTQKNSLSDRAEAMEHGGTDYITKPFNLDFLRGRITALVEQQGRSSERSVK